MARLDAASQPALPYPYWHQSFTAGDRLGDRLGDADLLLHAPYLGKPLEVEEDRGEDRPGEAGEAGETG